MNIKRTGFISQKSTGMTSTWKALIKGKYVYMMLFPVVLFYIIYHYFPMYGLLNAFKNYKPMLGIMGSPWVGFTNFMDFFSSFYFWRIIRNTVILSFYNLLFCFPAPIVLALLLNEVRKRSFKRVVQTISYLPHFVSLVVVIGILIDFFSLNGLVNVIVVALGGERVQYLAEASMFRPLYIGSAIWQQTGWKSIVFLAALASVSPQLYEAAIVDGAGRWKQLVHVTLPSIAPTIIIMLILGMGRIMNLGIDKILLMQNPLNMETSDVIATYVYRRGLIEFDFSYSTAVGLFNSAINFLFLVSINKLSRHVSETSLW